MIGYCVGVIQNALKSTIGYRMVFLDSIVPDIASIQTKVINATKEDVYSRLKADSKFISNLKIEDNKITGKGGSLTRYGVIDSSNMTPTSHSIVIIAEAYTHDSKFFGYLCSDSSGNIRELSEETIVQLSSSMQIANGKIVSHNGKQKVAAIEGAYSVYRKPKPKTTRKRTKVKEEPKTEQVKPEINKQEPITQTNPSIVSQKEDIKKETKNTENIEQTNTIQQSKNIDKPEQPAKTMGDKTEQEQQTKKDKIAQNQDTGENKQTEPLRKRTEEEMAEERIKKARVIAIELMKFKRYPGSYPEQIIRTISKSKPTRCSLKQYNALRDCYMAWIKNNSEVKDNKTLLKNPNIDLEYYTTDTEKQVTQTKPAQTEQPFTPKQEQKKTEPIKDAQTKPEPIQHEEIKPEPEVVEIELPAVPVASKSKIAPTLPVRTATVEAPEGLFEYEIIHGKMYITKYNTIMDENKRITSPRDILVPQQTNYNGKVYTITGIGYEAFANTPITSIKIGSNITDIAQGALSKCLDLEDVDLSESGITMIPMSMCANCVKLKAVKIGKNLERIHEKAFENCKNLYSVDAGSIETVAADAFRGCINLTIFNGRPKVIYDSAFRNCISLKNIDFSETVYIGTASFRGTGFEILTVPENLLRVGKKAFSDCPYLKSVFISEGVLELGEYCFAKSKGSCRTALADCGAGYSDMSFVPLEAINTPKSIEKAGNNPFMHTETVYGYIGTLCESKCKTHNIRFVNLDTINSSNATKVRLKTTVLGKSALNIVMNDYNAIANGQVPNITMDLNKDKLVEIALKQDVIDFLGLTETTEHVEPNIKFIGALNLMQDLVDIYAVPLSNKLISFRDAYRVSNEMVYDDGCNRIVKVRYTLRDSLLSGDFWAFIMDNKLVYCAEYTKQTNIKMRKEIQNSNAITLDRHLHTGDIIGYNSAFDGTSGMYRDEQTKQTTDIGALVQRTIDNLGIIIDVTNDRRFVYVPSAQGDKKVLELVDATKSLTVNQKKDYTRRFRSNNEEPLPIGSYSVNSILTYEEFLEALKSESKATLDDTKFFKEIFNLSESEIQQRISDINTIGVEMEAQLFQVSKQFNADLKKFGIARDDIDPSYISESVFRELAQSYWLIEQDEKWFKSVQTKSLNKMHEYTIGKYTLTELKSNQVVKFSNPYMKGKKGAYVFTLTLKGVTYGIYVSRYSIKEIALKLYDMTHIPKEINVNTLKPLMTDANNLDIVDKSLFYDFYPVLSHSGDWKLADYTSNLSYAGLKLLRYMYATFNISMYKPTGIFYLTMSRYIIVTDRDGEKHSQEVVLPIVPIGSMDRALMVADTTNVNNSKSDFAKDMSCLCIAEALKAHNLNESGRLPNVDRLSGYYMARQLIIDRDRTIEKYRDLVSDRVLYMLGVLHSGNLKREGEEELTYDIEEDDIDFGYDEYEEDDTDIEIDDTEEDFDISEEDYYDEDDSEEESDDTEETDEEIAEKVQDMLSLDIDSMDLSASEKEQLKSIQRILANMTPEEQRRFLNGG